MDRLSTILIVLGLLLSACQKHSNTDYEAALNKNSIADRGTHPYFKQDSFSWSLITPDQVPLYVLEAGKGATMVALHGGFGMEHSYMRPFLRPFEKDYHFVYYDQRGSLRSPVPENDFDRYITMENMVNDLELLRLELGEEKLTLVAHSMGAVLAYEYMRKYPDKVGNVIIISGFTPKFPDSKAAFHDMFLSQQEREQFKTRPAVQQELDKLRASMDTTTRAYQYLHWRINAASCQIYKMENWTKMDNAMGSFNPAINELIGPESNIPWSYFWKFYRYQKQFNQGKLVYDDRVNDKKPKIDYLPEIKKHPHKISYLMGRYEVGDFNLRLYERYLSELDNVDIHIFEEACHNIWMDQPEDFAQVLSFQLAEAADEELTADKH